VVSLHLGTPLGVGISHGHFGRQDTPRPGLGGSHHLPPYNILCATFRGLHPNGSFSQDSQVGVPKLSRNCPCRTPTLAKCGGEAQHLEKSGVGVLRDSRMFKARHQGPKDLALGCSWCHWKGLEV
jgi:hypothetical protein